MSAKKYWRVELDKVVRYAVYVIADTEEAARRIAITVEEDEVEEECVEWLEAEVSEADEDDALDGWILNRASGDGEGEE
jgi:hypothetical protein